MAEQDRSIDTSKTSDPMSDPVFAEEQAKLTETYGKLVELRDSLTKKLEVDHAAAAKDLKDLSDEVRIDYGGADETMETLASIETLNSVIDVYNQTHDFTVEKLRNLLVLLNQPYFAKVRLKLRPGRPARDIYIGTTGMTDEDSRPLIIDWRSPVAQTYYNQQLGPTSYQVDGRTINCDLELRRQFDITRDKLNGYFDSDIAIEDSLLLTTLQRHHSEKLQAITATIQREQNEVVRHEDVPVMLVNGIAGSGKTSVLLQRIAFLFYQDREHLDPTQVWLFTPNDVFERYIDTVLPSLGESNPETYTWRGFVASLGLDGRDPGENTDVAALRRIENGVGSLELEDRDFRDLRVDDMTIIKADQVASARAKFAKFAPSPRLMALMKDELHARADRRFAQIARSDDAQEDMLRLDLEEQMEVFGETVSPEDEKETFELTKRYVAHRYAAVHDQIENLDWLRLDRIGMRLTGEQTLNALEWIYLKITLDGGGARDARYVMVDEVQDYTAAQLELLARYFPHAHFLLLGDENQAIREGTASFAEIHDIFERTHGEVTECSLMTSYRSSPEITRLFMSLAGDASRVQASSIHRAGVKPEIAEVKGRDAYLDKLRSVIAEAQGEEGLCAIIADNGGTVNWLKKQLGPEGEKVKVLKGADNLPKDGVILIDLPLSKGLEFDQVIIPDATAKTYPDTPLARRRLYTAVSRAMHKVTLIAEDELSPLLASWTDDDPEGDAPAESTE